MNVGSVISSEEGLQVVTGISGDYVHTLPLKDYIIMSVMVLFNGEYRTLKEIIDMHCNEYISRNGIVDQNS